ncbi:MAG: hypothetical protein ABJB61_02210 [bacterium]
MKIPAVVANVLLICAFVSLANCQHSGSTQVRQRRVAESGERVTTRVASGENLQNAIDAAEFGDTIILKAGATYNEIILPYKPPNGDADYITIQTEGFSALVKDGERVKPAEHARAMAKILSPGGKPAVATAPQAHHYRFIGIEFAPAANSEYVHNLIDLGSSDYNSYSQFPHHLIFDRCYVHSTGLNKARRGFAINSAETSILNSQVSGFAGAGDETQAIAGWNGPGPFHIINNYLEGGAEVLLFGGSDPSISNLVPADIEIRRNYFYKQAEWAGKATIKGTFELKNARRVIVDGNLIEGGIRVTAFVITVRNQNGKAPWSTIEDVEITNNVVRHASAGVNILGSDNEHSSQRAKRIRVANNLFEDVANTSDIANFLIISGAESVTVEHNTVQQGGNIITSYGEPAPGFIFRNNIVQFNQYGVACSIQGPACTGIAFCQCFPGGTIKGNVIADNANASANDPIQKNFPGNYFVNSYDGAGFMDYAHGNWQLGSASKYRGKATDGRDPGVDSVALYASGVRSAKEGTAAAVR